MNNIPEFLNRPFNFEKISNIRDELSTIANARWLKVNEAGKIVKIGILEYLYEHLKGIFGYVDHAKMEILRFRVQQLLAQAAEEGKLTTNECEGAQSLVNSVAKRVGLNSNQNALLQEITKSVTEPNQSHQNLKKLLNQYRLQHIQELTPHSILTTISNAWKKQQEEREAHSEDFLHDQETAGEFSENPKQEEPQQPIAPTPVAINSQNPPLSPYVQKAKNYLRNFNNATPLKIGAAAAAGTAFLVGTYKVAAYLIEVLSEPIKPNISKPIVNKPPTTPPTVEPTIQPSNNNTSSVTHSDSGITVTPSAIEPENVPQVSSDSLRNVTENNSTLPEIKPSEINPNGTLPTKSPEIPDELPPPILLPNNGSENPQEEICIDPVLPFNEEKPLLNNSSEQNSLINQTVLPIFSQLQEIKLAAREMLPTWWTFNFSIGLTAGSVAACGLLGGWLLFDKWREKKREDHELKAIREEVKQSFLNCLASGQEVQEDYKLKLRRNHKPSITKGPKIDYSQKDFSSCKSLNGTVTNDGFEVTIPKNRIIYFTQYTPKMDNPEHDSYLIVYISPRPSSSQHPYLEVFSLNGIDFEDKRILADAFANLKVNNSTITIPVYKSANAIEKKSEELETLLKEAENNAGEDVFNSRDEKKERDFDFKINTNPKEELKQITASSKSISFPSSPEDFFRVYITQDKLVIVNQTEDMNQIGAVSLAEKKINRTDLLNAIENNFFLKNGKQVIDIDQSETYKTKLMAIQRIQKNLNNLDDSQSTSQGQGNRIEYHIEIEKNEKKNPQIFSTYDETLACSCDMKKLIQEENGSHYIDCENNKKVIFTLYQNKCQPILLVHLLPHHEDTFEKPHLFEKFVFKNYSFNTVKQALAEITIYDHDLEIPVVRIHKSEEIERKKREFNQIKNDLKSVDNRQDYVLEYTEKPSIQNAKEDFKLSQNSVANFDYPFTLDTIINMENFISIPANTTKKLYLASYQKNNSNFLLVYNLNENNEIREIRQLTLIKPFEEKFALENVFVENNRLCIPTPLWLILKANNDILKPIAKIFKEQSHYSLKNGCFVEEKGKFVRELSKGCTLKEITPETDSIRVSDNTYFIFNDNLFVKIDETDTSYDMEFMGHSNKAKILEALQMIGNEKVLNLKPIRENNSSSLTTQSG